MSTDMVHCILYKVLKLNLHIGSPCSRRANRGLSTEFLQKRSETASSEMSIRPVPSGHVLVSFGLTLLLSNACYFHTPVCIFCSPIGTAIVA